MDKGVRRNLVKKHMERYNKPKAHKTGIDYKRKDKYVKTVPEIETDYVEDIEQGEVDNGIL